jgi:hypothetical protein
MTDEKYYQKWSKAALKRSKEQVPDFDALEQFLTVDRVKNIPSPIG